MSSSKIKTLIRWKNLRNVCGFNQLGKLEEKNRKRKLGEVKFVSFLKMG